MFWKLSRSEAEVTEQQPSMKALIFIWRCSFLLRKLESWLEKLKVSNVSFKTSFFIFFPYNIFEAINTLVQEIQIDYKIYENIRILQNIREGLEM